MPSSIRSIAILNPLADYGISSYTHELAQGLIANDVDVDVYTHPGPIWKAHARRYRCFAVLGNPLFRQPEAFHAAPASFKPSNGSHGAASTPPPGKTSALYRHLRAQFLGFELALHLKRSRYDVVWTQWPDMADYGSNFWKLGAMLGLKMVHTVHNLLPHEEGPDDRREALRVYNNCALLFVHSEAVKKELAAMSPELSPKVAVSPHGLYTIFPRCPHHRLAVRRKLGISPQQKVLLFSGSIRPYKNIDAVIGALALDPNDDVILVVAGKESHYTDCHPRNHLARTERIAREAGVAHRVRLLPGHQTIEEMAELLEASDILMLPYLKGYGSGMLLLGMTFGKHIVTTPVGGAAEYLKYYPRHTLLPGASARDIADGLREACGARSVEPLPQLQQFEWRNIASQSLAAITEMFDADRKSAPKKKCASW